MLENKSLSKLMYDCRSDADALYHLFHVRIRNVVDIQVLFVKTQFSSGARYLPGMGKALSEAPLLSPRAAKKAAATKTAGLQLFAPEKGGSYAVWRKRPLSPALLEYAAEDVAHLFTMFDAWSSPGSAFSRWRFDEKWLNEVAERRMQTVISLSALWPRGPHSRWTLIDF